jgi:hypothetical protein
MRSIKTVLFCGAALAGLSLQAQADDLSALKHEIEQLNSRLAQLEAAPALPADAALVTISRGAAPVVPGLAETDPGYGDTATVISVRPTADAAASTTITWTGYARAGLVHVNYEDQTTYTASDLDLNGNLNLDDDYTSTVTEVDDELDVYSRGEIKVVGETATSVGEVGALVKIRGDFDGNGTADAYVKEAWGWWALTPELTLGGGYTGSLGNIGYGYDGSCNCYYTDNANVSMDPGDTTQFRMTYASGPVTMAVALEDGSEDSGSTYPKSLGAAGEIKHAGDMISGEIAAVWRDGDDADDLYQIGAGAGFSFASIATINIGAAYGQTHDLGKYWVASALASVTLTDAIHAEVAYGHREYEDEQLVEKDNNQQPVVNAVLGGAYYDPVSQLTVGLEAEWIKDYSTQIDVVTVFRF